MDHSLSSFQARANAFREAWFNGRRQASHLDYDGDTPMSNAHDSVEVSEDDVEREFWRLVESPTESVEIEYGADVHSTTHGRYVSQFLISLLQFDSLCVKITRTLQCNAHDGDTSSQ
jgi:hypothetical protein